MKKLITFLVICLTAVSCSSPPEEKSQRTPGEDRLQVDGGEIWYKVTGDGDKVPIVLLHGGPGFNSFYLKPFERLADDRPVIRYDQLGSGKSDMIEDTTKFTVERYVDELETLRKHLGIEKWHILGHSWGSMLAMSYYNEFPEHVETLTLASPCLNSAQWAESTNELLELLPDSVQEAVNIADSTGNYENPQYQAAMELFYEKYVFGDTYPAADMDSTMSTFNEAIYGYMWGPSEFTIRGTLKDFNVVGDLKNVKVPVLFTVGEMDEINPEIVKKWAMEVSDSRVVIFEGSSHMTPWNAESESVEVQRMFLSDSQQPDE